MSPHLHQVGLDVVHQCLDGLQLLVQSLYLEEWVGTCVKHHLGHAVFEDKTQHVVAELVVATPFDPLVPWVHCLTAYLNVRVVLELWILGDPPDGPDECHFVWDSWLVGVRTPLTSWHAAL